MCAENTEVAAVGSFYFMGFVGGLLLLPMPDKLGRKGSYKIILTIILFASGLTLCSKNLYLKTIGMFI